MFKSIYLLNNRYIERLECHLLISIQTLIFQPQFITQTLILRLGDLQDWTCSSQRTSGISNELCKPLVKSFVTRTVKRQLINKFKSKVQHHLYTNVPSLQIQARIRWKKRTRKICDSNLSLASINNPVTSLSQKVHHIVVKLNQVESQATQALFMNHTMNTIWRRIIRVCMGFSTRYP